MSGGARGAGTTHLIPALSLGLLVLIVGTMVSACDPGYNFSSTGNQRGPGSLSPSSLGSGSTTTTAGSPLCLARDLAAKGSSRQNPNDTGSAIGEVIISNSAQTACELRGAPSLHLLKLTGSPVQVQNATSVSPVLPPVVIQAKGKNEAELVFTWQNWCSTAPGSLKLQVDLANGGGAFVAPIDSPTASYVPACVRPNAPSVLRVQYAYVSAGTTKFSTA